MGHGFFIWMVTDPENRYGIGPDRLTPCSWAQCAGTVTRAYPLQLGTVCRYGHVGLPLVAGHSVQVRSHKGCHSIPSGTDLHDLAYYSMDSLGIDMIACYSMDSLGMDRDG